MFPGIERLHQSEEYKQRQAEDAILRSVGRERLVELAQAEQDGRLVVLPPPAKEGDPKPECFYNETNNPWAWCLGMAKSRDDDEPQERCKACWYCESTRQEAETAKNK